MSLIPLQELLDKLRIGDESLEIEAKSGSSIDKSVMESVCAFANEPGLHGGYILLGVQEEPDGLFGVTFSVVGVQNPGKLQSDLATRCRSELHPPVRPEIRPEVHEGKTVIVVFVPEAPPGDKPVHFKSDGLPQGAFRRIASSDMHCTDEDLALLYQGRSGTAYDASVVDGSGPDDVDPAAVREYRLRRAEVQRDASELRFDDAELLYALNATTKVRGEVRLTVAGLILFGKEASLRRLLPMHRADYILVEGREWVKDPGSRFAAVEMRGPLLTLIPRVVQQVLADIPAAFSLGEGDIHRKDVPLIPRTVIREAVVNALMHRSYRASSPVQLLRYSNRLEIRNVGYSLKPEERLGDPGSMPRNPSIAAVLHEAGLAETKGSGIRTMRELMNSANLTPPFFESDREKDEFGLMLLVHHLLSEQDLAWLNQFRALGLNNDEARVLVVVREAGVITNAMYREMTGLETLVASRSLQHLRDAGLLEQKGKGRATNYRPTGLLLHGPADQAGKLAEQSGKLPGQSGKVGPQSGKPSARRQEVFHNTALPPNVLQTLAELKGRASKAQVREAILVLCAWKPLPASDLAELLGRTPAYLQETFLGPMVREGVLAYTIPATPLHPDQAYQLAARSSTESAT